MRILVIFCLFFARGLGEKTVLEMLESVSNCPESVLAAVKMSTKSPILPGEVRAACNATFVGEKGEEKLCLALYFNLKSLCGDNKNVAHHLHSIEVSDDQMCPKFAAVGSISVSCATGPEEEELLCQKYNGFVNKLSTDVCPTTCLRFNFLCKSVLHTLEMLQKPKLLGEDGHGTPPPARLLQNQQDKAHSEIESPPSEQRPNEEQKTDVGQKNGGNIPDKANNSGKQEVLQVPLSTVLPTKNPATQKAETVPKTTEKVVEEKNPSNVHNQDSLAHRINTNQVYQMEKHLNDDEAISLHTQFFSYFVVITIICLSGYLILHNKKKILALLLEGRRKNSGRRARNSSAQYHKLDNNLEEAMGPHTESSVGQIIY